MYFNRISISKKITTIALSGILSLAFSFQLLADTTSTAEHSTLASSSNQAEKERAHEQEEFNITGFILNHIADAHDFHFWGEGHHSVSLALPVILWTDKGLVTFMSSSFHHDDEGEVVVEKKGQRFVKAREKIYYALDQPNLEGGYVEFGADNKAVNLRPLDFSITKNVFSLIFSAIVLFIVFAGVGRAYNKREGKAPKGFQSLIEPVILFIRDDVAIPNLGYKYERYMPYLLTAFFFIWFNNVLGLVPFFPGGANLTGNIAVTFVLALFTFIITTVQGNKYYWGHVFKPNVPWWLYPLMIPIEIIGLFTKPMALMIRLFANISAGHILVLSLLCLIFVFKSIYIAPVSVVFVVFINLIELLVGFIQAFIFTILSALFIGIAIEEHADH